MYTILKIMESVTRSCISFKTAGTGYTCKHYPLHHTSMYVYIFTFFCFYWRLKLDFVLRYPQIQVHMWGMKIYLILQIIAFPSFQIPTSECNFKIQSICTKHFYRIFLSNKHNLRMCVFTWEKWLRNDEFEKI